MEKIFDIAKDSEQKWGVIAQGIDGNFEKLSSKVDEKTNKKQGINLFNPNDADVLIGKFINYSGDIGTSFSYNASGYIPVKEGKTYYCAKDSSNGYRFVCCYDSDKNVVASAFEEVREFTAPEGCVYVRVSFYAASYDYAQVSVKNRAYCHFDNVGTELDYTLEDEVEGNVVEKSAIIADNNIIQTNKSVGDIISLSYVYSKGNCCAIEEVAEGDIVKYAGTQSSRNVFCILNADNKVIYAETSSPVEGVVTIPSGGVKVVLVSTIAANHYLKIINGGQVLARLYPIESSIGFKYSSINLVDPMDSEVREGYYYAGDWVSFAALDTTGFIPVENGHTYKMFPNIPISVNNTNLRIVSLFDANKNFLSYVAEVELVTISDENVKYIRVSFYNRSSASVDRERNISDIAISDISIASSFNAYNPVFIPYIVNGMGWDPASVANKKYVDAQVKNVGNILHGKKWVACGDSFTHGDYSNSPTSTYTIESGMYAGQLKVYPYLIGNRNHMTIVNEAVNGSTMTYIDGTINEFSKANGRYTQIPEDADYITLKFGINDDSGHQGVTLGAIDDTDNTTFYGAWNVVMEYIITNHPQAKIGIIVTNGSTLPIVNATIAIAEKWGVPYLNEATDKQCSFLFRSLRDDVVESIRTMKDTQWYVSSTLNHHPNEYAHEFESSVVENWLRSL